MGFCCVKVFNQSWMCDVVSCVGFDPTGVCVCLG